MTTATQNVIRDLAAIERLAELPRPLRLCAARTATELNGTDVAWVFGVPNRTTHGHLALLATACHLQLVPAWPTNLSSKVVGNRQEREACRRKTNRLSKGR